MRRVSPGFPLVRLNAGLTMDTISKYRGQLMGLAIIAIVACHLSQLYPVVPFIRFGSIGVEIFFFLSGMGLVYSYRRNSSPIQFYGRRALRILPSYYIVLLLSAAVYGASVLCWKYVLMFGMFRWFISTICLYYLLFPPYMALCRKVSPYVVYLLICCVVAVCFACLRHWISPFWFARAPVFFLGCLCVQSEKCANSTKAWMLVALPSLVLFGLCNLQREVFEGIGVLALVRTLMTPGLCLALAWLLAKCDKQSWGKPVMWCLGIYGMLSLEVYLLEQNVRHAVHLGLGVDYWPLDFILVLPLAAGVYWLSKGVKLAFCRKPAGVPPSGHPQP